MDENDNRRGLFYIVIKRFCTAWLFNVRGFFFSAVMFICALIKVRHDHYFILIPYLRFRNFNDRAKKDEHIESD